MNVVVNYSVAADVCLLASVFYNKHQIPVNAHKALLLILFRYEINLLSSHNMIMSTQI